jgi:hypothetical protein
VGKKISLRDALASDPTPLRASPAWTNTELGTVNGVSVLHAGIGEDRPWWRRSSPFPELVECSLPRSVTRTNRRARTFYERHGYAHVGDLAGFVRAGIAESLYLKSWRA